MRRGDEEVLLQPAIAVPCQAGHELAHGFLPAPSTHPPRPPPCLRTRVVARGLQVPARLVLKLSASASAAPPLAHCGIAVGPVFCMVFVVADFLERLFCVAVVAVWWMIGFCRVESRKSFECDSIVVATQLGL